MDNPRLDHLFWVCSVHSSSTITAILSAGIGFVRDHVLADFQTPQRCTCEALLNFPAGRAFFRRQEHPGERANDGRGIVGLISSGSRWENPAQRLFRLLAKLV